MQPSTREGWVSSPAAPERRAHLPPLLSDQRPCDPHTLLHAHFPLGRQRRHLQCTAPPPQPCSSGTTQGAVERGHSVHHARACLSRTGWRLAVASKLDCRCHPHGAPPVAGTQPHLRRCSQAGGAAAAGAAAGRAGPGAAQPNSARHPGRWCWRRRCCSVPCMLSWPAGQPAPSGQGVARRVVCWDGCWAERLRVLMGTVRQPIKLRGMQRSNACAKARPHPCFPPALSLRPHTSSWRSPCHSPLPIPFAGPALRAARHRTHLRLGLHS